MPEELFLYIQCDKYNSLLVSGGILEQPYWLWHLVDYAGLCYTAARAEIEEAEFVESATERLAEEALKNALIQKQQKK